MSEKIPSPESQEARIERLIAELAAKEEMQPEDILSDIITFAPHPENESANPYYFEELAERLAISLEEIKAYAVKKYEEYTER